MEDTAELLGNLGMYLITIEYCSYKVSLYSLNEEFYEIFYNSAENKIEKIIHAVGDDLHKYLSIIDLSL